MNPRAEYAHWLNHPYFDAETRAELRRLGDAPDEVHDRFYRRLEFGTGGLRGKMGAGTNRMNVYIIRWATTAVAAWLIGLGEENRKKGIVIAYDSRHRSKAFAQEAAGVLAVFGFTVYFFQEIRPTPELSFAVRQLGAAGGIVITASHNPKEYNGFKVYGPDGAQISLEDAEAVSVELRRFEELTSLETMAWTQLIEAGPLNFLGPEFDQIYLDQISLLSPLEGGEVPGGLRVAFTPLHGAGFEVIPRLLRERGVELLRVEPQSVPDGEFPTVKSPNPEDPRALSLGIAWARASGAEILIGTDPDADRMGVAVRNAEGEYGLLTGNQIGCLLLEQRLSELKRKGQLPEHGFVVKTIVTTELARDIAKYYGVALVETLTGFKFIAEQIRIRDEEGEERFLFGFEESYGYLAGTFVRDKDAVIASMLMTDLASRCRAEGKTLWDLLEHLYQRHGYHLEATRTFTLDGEAGGRIIASAMERLRAEAKKKGRSAFSGEEVLAVRDLQSGIRTAFPSLETESISLPASDVLYFELSGRAWFCIRPSGTEPKIKLYFGAVSSSREGTDARLTSLISHVLAAVSPLLEAAC